MSIKSEKIELVDVQSLVPYEKNMNSHTEEQIKRLCGLIKYQGFRDPIIAQKGTNVIAAGHCRLEAAKRLGFKKVPVIYQEFDNEAQFYAFVVSHNAIASWSELDLDEINKEILEFEDFDLELLGINGFEEINPVEVDIPALSDQEPDCQQVTFVLSNEQRDLLDEALSKAKKEEDCSDEINKNSNGNALAALLRRYVHS